MKEKQHPNYLCVHAGQLKDTIYGGATAPIYTSTAYDYRGEGTNLYPRYFNTPNQVALGKKMAALEHTEAGMIFGSGMAAISAVFLAFLKTGDHIILQRAIYGGTSHFVAAEFEKLGIEFTMIEHVNKESLQTALKSSTKMVYMETPSNPLLEVTDMTLVSAFAKANSLTSVIDNTFASPINQNPADFGIDIIIHSATKYLGGHSDICAGTVSCSQQHMDQLWKTAKNYGGSLSDQTVYLLERSIKTLGLRVKQQSKTAKKIARFLEKHPDIKKVNYPGLKSHPQYTLAKKQMKAYGGMMSFELEDHINETLFLELLEVIFPALSLAGVESTILAPTTTSHSLLTPEERKEQGISDRLLRFSVGIEEASILIADLENAINNSRSK
ncbi:cystathionine beta-lyase [Nonlabens dokdonensis]|uniref:Cys/Met metabolism PLP-dependent enzyme n=2 Tax=Nonlabens dokdonensis TaxID=328515 RepID=L7W656_NONDD|nr:PLP-dependent aspartate aminotransferase family protein [Nonlabens dokdonensis]AGC75261.1 Cys/Met metabolism PLP-dependent enzyme [Nonlabens dokdonensis DSW-6]PZX39001.1 cystathionine beta-lyase [Nonlabens dokdonensis]